METQPQLLLLQKTLLGIESLGRKLYPELDLWNTAKPFLENWIRQRKSPRRLLKQFVDQLQPNTERLLQLPEKLDHFLVTQSSMQLRSDKTNYKKKHSVLYFIGLVGLITTTVFTWIYHLHTYSLSLSTITILLLIDLLISKNNKT